jgi:hypothetical protein
LARKIVGRYFSIERGKLGNKSFVSKIEKIQMAVMKYFSCGALALVFFPLEQPTQKKVEKQNKTFLKKLKCQRKQNSMFTCSSFLFSGSS